MFEVLYQDLAFLTPFLVLIWFLRSSQLSYKA